MSHELLINMFYAAPELWYIIGVFIAALFFVIIYMGIKILKLKQKNYFINRDRDRYIETLYASKDGYFTFIYPDDKVNDPITETQEKCSRRLAVLLNLEKGINASFEDVMRCFYKDDAKKIVKYIELLREEGVPFEEVFVSKNDNRQINISGSRINGTDGTIYADMIWFRDITAEKLKILNLIEEKEGFFHKILQLEDMINNVPYPVWLRDENLNIIIANKKYYEFIGNKDLEEKSDIELKDTNGENVSKNLALTSIASNKAKSTKTNIVLNGQINIFEVTETPFYSELNLDKIRTVGALTNISELEEIKRNIKFNQEAQLEILGSIGNTAFAVFDNKHKLSFHNKSFKKMWSLEDIVLENSFSYSGFLDIIREKRLLPEVSNFINYKEEEISSFSSMIEPCEDMLHIPDGRTIRRVRAAYPTGGLIFAFEDVSDKLATRRAYNSLLSIQKEVIENIFDAVLVFDSNGKLNAYNQAYIDLWKANPKILSTEPSIFDIINAQKPFFENIDNWKNLQDTIVKHITNITTKSFVLKRKDNMEIDVLARTLSDGSIMVTYKKIA